MQGHPKPFRSGMTPTHIPIQMDLTHPHKAPGEPYHLNLNISGIKGGLGRSQRHLMPKRGLFNRVRTKNRTVLGTLAGHKA